MLRIEFVNDQTGPDEAANYRARVEVNGRLIAAAQIHGRPRSEHWTTLVERLLELTKPTAP
jgi:hypothetical protein